MVKAELERPSFVAWYRNPSRAMPAALRIAYQVEAGKWTSLQPDFVVLSRKGNGSLGLSSSTRTETTSPTRGRSCGRSPGNSMTTATSSSASTRRPRTAISSASVLRARRGVPSSADGAAGAPTPPSPPAMPWAALSYDQRRVRPNTAKAQVSGYARFVPAVAGTIQTDRWHAGPGVVGCPSRWQSAAGDERSRHADEHTDTTSADAPDEGGPADEDAAEATEPAGANSVDQDAATASPTGYDPVAYIRSANRSQIGQLTLHYPSRDVTSNLDGDAAIRIMSMFTRDRADLADHLDPRMSWAGNGWLALDLTSLMAISWEPGDGIGASRTVVDPIPVGS